MSKNINEQLPKELRSTFYQDNPKKVFVLSMLSAGFYEFLWFYRHWRHFKRRAVVLNKTNQSNLVTHKKDKNIIPFWSAFFCGFYIVGIARRIRDKFKSGGFSNFETGPWWAWLFYGNYAFLSFFQGTSDINFNVNIFLLDILLVAISTWQITRLQIKANEYMNLTKESANIIEVHFKKWDIIILVIGFVLGVFNLIGVIYPV